MINKFAHSMRLVLTFLAFTTLIGIVPSVGFTENAFAQAPATNKNAGIQWNQLNDSQKEILGPLENDWESLGFERKQKWLQVAAKFSKLPSADQERLKSRMREWAKLSSNERRIARDNYLQSLSIPSEKKAEAWQAYQQLSPEEKKKLAEEAAQKKPSLINSPSLKSK